MQHLDWALVAAGLGVGIVVGLTGMGGGALMTPVLVLFFGVPPLAAVSSDLVASAVMKPVGSLVHIVRRTVDWRLVRWLSVGSVPSAFCGVLLARAVGGGHLQTLIRYALGIALLTAVVGLLARALISRSPAGTTSPGTTSPGTGPGPGTRVRVRPLPTLLLGALGGLLVGMTSVGSGSLIIVALLALYPALRPGDLVGTDLVQAVPLVVAAALGHLLFGEFRLDVAGPLLLGSIPGVFLGAQISSRTRGGWIRGVLAIVLLASALKLLKVPNVPLLVALAAATAVGLVGWRLAVGRFGTRRRAPGAAR